MPGRVAGARSSRCAQPLRSARMGDRTNSAPERLPNDGQIGHYRTMSASKPAPSASDSTWSTGRDTAVEIPDEVRDAVDAVLADSQLTRSEREILTTRIERWYPDVSDGLVTLYGEPIATRTAAALLSVILSTALIAATLVISASYTAQLRSAAALSLRGAGVVVSSGGGINAPGHRPFDDALRDQLAQIDGVAQARGERALEVLSLDVAAALQGATGTQVNLADSPELSAYTRLTSGRLPTEAGETAISSSLAEQNGLAVGDTLKLAAFKSDPGTKASLRVVGVLEVGPDATSETGLHTAFVAPQQFDALGIATEYKHIYLTLAPGADADAVMRSAEAEARAYQDSAIVRSAEKTITDRTAARGQGSNLALKTLTILSPLCALVAGIVIMTVFTTLVARQTRYIGLLRAVGAGRRQVMIAVLRTGSAIGLAGALIGCAVGAGAAAGFVFTGESVLTSGSPSPVRRPGPPWRFRRSA